MSRKFYKTKLVYEHIGMEKLYDGISPLRIGRMENDGEIFPIGDEYWEEDMTQDEFLTELEKIDPGYAAELRADWEAEDE